MEEDKNAITTYVEDEFKEKVKKWADKDDRSISSFLKHSLKNQIKAMRSREKQKAKAEAQDEITSTDQIPNARQRKKSIEK
jgi:predicted transcriptional regulator